MRVFLTLSTQKKVRIEVNSTALESVTRREKAKSFLFIRGAAKAAENYDKLYLRGTRRPEKRFFISIWSINFFLRSVQMITKIMVYALVAENQI